MSTNQALKRWAAKKYNPNVVDIGRIEDIFEANGLT